MFLTNLTSAKQLNLIDPHLYQFPSKTKLSNSNVPLIPPMSTAHIYQCVHIQITHLQLHLFYQCSEFPQRIKVVHIQIVSK